MKALVFDTETSGLWRDQLPASHPSQPHLLQLSAKLIDGDGLSRGDMTLTIQPDGWHIEEGALAVHGITAAEAQQCGVPAAAALFAFKGLVKQSDVIVAHNVQFDRMVIHHACVALRTSTAWWDERANTLFCTMESSAPLLDLPGPIPGSPKYPSLDEAYTFFFPTAEKRSGFHDARYDRNRCADIYLELVKERKSEKNSYQEETSEEKIERVAASVREAKKTTAE